ncbi:MAG: hypothetical protein R3B82_22800 [Sandaracinaceae bacterium]
MTLVELEALGEVPPALREVFERADAIAFGHATFAAADLSPEGVERALEEQDR